MLDEESIRNKVLLIDKENYSSTIEYFHELIIEYALNGGDRITLYSVFKSIYDELEDDFYKEEVVDEVLNRIDDYTGPLLRYTWSTPR